MLRRWICATLLAGPWWFVHDAGATGPEFSGFVDASYNRNLRADDTRTNVYHSFDAKGNTFLLNAVHIAMTGSGGEQLDYVVEVDMGSDAVTTTSGGIGVSDDIDIQEAYVTYRFEASNLGFRAGKFATYSGIEVIESGENPTITRGFLFGLAEAFTHTGIVATYQVSAGVDVHAGAINGWDLLADNNGAPVGVAKIGLDFGAPLGLTISGYYGPEQAGNTDNMRTSFDITGITRGIPDLDLWFQFNYGREDQAALSGGGASWVGIGIQPVYHLTDAFSLGGRYELFKDADGARTATAQTLQNVSIAPAYALAENLLTRAEFRLDLSDEDVFLDADNAATSRQLLVSAELVLSF